MHRSVLAAVGCLAVLAFGGSALAAPAATFDNHLTPVSRADPEVAGANGSLATGVSATGRWVLFASSQPNVIPGAPTDGGRYLFLYDANTAATVQVSHGFGGSVTGNSTISGNGRWVVYSATETPDSDNQLYLYDRIHATTAVISPPETDAERAADGVWFAVDISGDGRYVVYTRSSGADPEHVTRHLYRYDATTGATALLVPGDLRGTIDRVADSAVPSVSDDGRYVAYLQSTPTGDPAVGSRFTLTSLDTATGIKTKIVTSGFGYEHLISDPSMSDSGRYIAYSLAPADLSSEFVYRWDSHTGASALVSRTPSGAQPNAASGQPRISGDGRYVVYISDASDIVTGSSGRPLIYLYDATTAVNVSLVLDKFGSYPSGDNSVYGPYIDRHGDHVVFTSPSRILVPHVPSRLERAYLWTR
jgi:Tol biopolymer transport system component